MVHKSSLKNVQLFELNVKMLKATYIFDQEYKLSGIFLVDVLHKGVQSLADRPVRAANMPVDRRSYANILAATL